MMTADQLSTTFAALADPTRRAILQRLAHSQATVGELAEPFGISLPAISKHLKVLEKADLISRHKDAQWRLCKLQAEPLQAAAAWISQYQQFWEGRLDALADYLNQQKKDAES